MSNPIIDNIISQLEQQVLADAKTAGIQAGSNALVQIEKFVKACLPKISRWIQAFLDKTITEDEFKTLLEDLGDDALENVFTIAGEAEVEVDKTKDLVLKSIIGFASSAVKMIPI